MDDTHGRARQPLHEALLTLEAQCDSGHGDRQWIHRRIAELRSATHLEANPVLRAEYLRRLAMLDGTDSKRVMSA